MGREPRHGDLFIVPITSKASNTESPLSEWQAAGLNVPCGIKAQLATVDETLVLKTVGRLSSRDQALVDQRLRMWLGL
jgi:hypothetical protein